MKSRGVYETPAGTVLYEALEDLCRLTLPHDLLRTRAELAPRYADLVYNGPLVLAAAPRAAGVRGHRHGGGDRRGRRSSCTAAAPRAVARTSP